MYALINSMNGNVISRHRTPEAAGKADAKFQRAVKRANGQGSYLPTHIVDGDGERLDDETHARAYNDGY